MTDVGKSLPPVNAGPILCKSSPGQLVLWLAVRKPVRVRITIDAGEGSPHNRVLSPGQTGCRYLTAGTRLHYLLIDLRFDEPLPRDRWVGYTVALQALATSEGRWSPCEDWAPDLCYPGKTSPDFVLPSRVGSLLHGSCRKPHHGNGDGLVEADRLLARFLEQGVASTEQDTGQAMPPDQPPAWPSGLVLTGDQIYADDVAGPMPHAIHQTITMLDLPHEPLAARRTTT